MAKRPQSKLFKPSKAFDDLLEEFKKDLSVNAVRKTRRLLARAFLEDKKLAAKYNAKNDEEQDTYRLWLAEKFLLNAYHFTRRLRMNPGLRTPTIN